MDSLIIVTPSHRGQPVICRLGDETQVILASDFNAPDAFELASPAYIPNPESSSSGETISSDEEIPFADESVVSSEDLSTTPATIILDDEESFNLYRCLHTLYGLKRLMNP